jgi:RHS repeat-associated protein
MRIGNACGQMLGATPDAASSAPTKYLYTREQYDSQLSQYYLRARYGIYPDQSGTHPTAPSTPTVPYAGSPQDPQSLHKYLYCHANPINNIDPSGRSIVGAAMAVGAWVLAHWLPISIVVGVGVLLYFALRKQCLVKQDFTS